jgi:hypothetical protein
LQRLEERLDEIAENRNHFDGHASPDQQYRRPH